MLFYIIIIIFIILCFIISNLWVDNFNNTNYNIDYYVIHIRSNKDRYANILANQEKLSQNIIIFDAVIGKEIDLNNLQIFDPQFQNNFNYSHVNEIGCYLSHFTLIKQIMHNPGYTVVFEDDFLINSNDLDSQIRHIISIVDDFDIICLGNLNNNHGTLYKENIYSIDYYNYLWGTHGYLINNKNAYKIYDKLLTMTLAIDNQYKKLFDNKILNGLVVYPNLVEQQTTAFKSTIR